MRLWKNRPNVAQPFFVKINVEPKPWVHVHT
jgi:hypothetical protein